MGSKGLRSAALCAALLASPSAGWCRLGVGSLLQRIEPAPEAERRLIIQALGARRKRKAVPELLRRLDLQRGDLTLNSAILWALGEVGGPEAAAGLLTAWGSLDERAGALRLEALQALERCGDPRALPILRKALESGDEAQVATALDGLERGRDRESLDAILRLAQGGNIKAVAALGALGDGKALAALRAAAESRNPGVKLAAAYGLARSADKGAFAVLDEGLREPGAGGLNAAFYLARLGKTRGLDRLLAGLEDPNQDLRFFALGLLRDLGDRRVVLPMIERVPKETSPVLRQHIVYCVARIGGGRARYELRRLLKRADPGLRVEVRDALSRLGDYEAP